jgi:hypothetical protein
VAQRAITDIADTLEELADEVDQDDIRHELFATISELRDKAKDIAIDIYNK